MRISDWSSDVCSSDLIVDGGVPDEFYPAGLRVELDFADMAPVGIGVVVRLEPFLRVQARCRIRRQQGRVVRRTCDGVQSDGQIGSRDRERTVAKVYVRLYHGRPSCRERGYQ